jgi:hypothetical protein
MQKLIFSISLFCALNSTCKAQTKINLDSNGNYVQSSSGAKLGTYKDTLKVFVTKSGEKLPIYESSKGKLFVFCTSKNGNVYRKYLTIEN